MQDAEWRYADRNSTTNAKTNSTRKSSSATGQNGIVKTAMKNRQDYRMKHGKAIETSKAARDVTGQYALQEYSEDRAAEEEARMNAEAAKAYADASSKAAASQANAEIEKARLYADAYKNRNTTETKNINYSGIDTILKGGSVQAVNPAEVKGEYDV